MFDAFVGFQARLQPRAPAVFSPMRQASYAELDADVNRFAAGLTALSLTPAAGVVAVDLGDDYLRCVTLLALARMGVASSPGEDERADLLLSGRDDRGPRRRLHLAPDWIAATLASNAAAFTPVRGEPDAIGRVMLSSGATEAPRRIRLSWRMLEAGVHSVGVTYGAGRAGRWLPFAGLDSTMGLHTALGAWAAGAAVIVGVPMADLPEALETLQPTLLGVTPVLLRTLLRRLPADFAAQPGLRVVVGGGSLPQSLAREARLRLSPDLKVTYGGGECSGACVADAALLETTPGIAGYAAPGVTIKVVDAEGAPVPPGVRGEVRIESERAASGYVDDPAASARAFRDGGFHPGDLGRLAPDGLLVIDGRLDLGGHEFQPTVLEEVALDCPGVVDAAAFPAPDAAGVDLCWLAVVQGEGFDRARLVAHLKQHRPALPPVRFAWISEIPRNAMGEVERRRLREETMAALGVGEAGQASS